MRSSYGMTKTRSCGWAWLYASSSAVAWSRNAVLPLPFSPKTSAVDGSDGLPKNLSQAGWWIVPRQRRLKTVSVCASSSLNGLLTIPWWLKNCSVFIETDTSP